MAPVVLPSPTAAERTSRPDPILTSVAAELGL
jgi:hypothetical protein